MANEYVSASLSFPLPLSFFLAFSAPHLPVILFSLSEQYSLAYLTHKAIRARPATHTHKGSHAQKHTYAQKGFTYRKPSALEENEHKLHHTLYCNSMPNYFIFFANQGVSIYLFTLKAIEEMSLSL